MELYLTLSWWHIGIMGALYITLIIVLIWALHKRRAEYFNGYPGQLDVLVLGCDSAWSGSYRATDGRDVVPRP